MNLFRSEEHIARWLGAREPGATITVTKLSELATPGGATGVAPDWRPHTREQNAAILERLGLTGPFWQLRLRRTCLAGCSRSLRHAVRPRSTVPRDTNPFNPVQ